MAPFLLALALELGGNIDRVQAPQPDLPPSAATRNYPGRAADLNLSRPPGFRPRPASEVWGGTGPSR